MTEADTPYSHCGSLTADRLLGEMWERNFCCLAGEWGRSFTPHQLQRTLSARAYHKPPGGKWNAWVLPDVTVWTAPGEHHEIKHKEPTRSGEFGLERYRFDALMAFAEETEQAVYYTIHNHARCGGREARINRIADWMTCDILRLKGCFTERCGTSWINGVATDTRIYYWPTNLWLPLADVWKRTGR